MLTSSATTTGTYVAFEGRSAEALELGNRQKHSI